MIVAVYGLTKEIIAFYHYYCIYLMTTNQDALDFYKSAKHTKIYLV